MFCEVFVPFKLGSFMAGFDPSIADGDVKMFFLGLITQRRWLWVVLGPVSRSLETIRISVSRDSILYFTVVVLRFTLVIIPKVP